MKINTYLDSTYLKTPAQSGLSEEETLETVFNLSEDFDFVLFCFESIAILGLAKLLFASF